MYVPNQMHLFNNTRRFGTNGIEAVSVTLGLPNAGHLQLALLYRSPSVSLAQAPLLVQVPLPTQAPLLLSLLLKKCAVSVLLTSVTIKSILISLFVRGLILSGVNQETLIRSG